MALRRGISLTRWLMPSVFVAGLLGPTVASAAQAGTAANAGSTCRASSRARMSAARPEDGSSRRGPRVSGGSVTTSGEGRGTGSGIVVNVGFGGAGGASGSRGGVGAPAPFWRARFRASAMRPMS